MQAIHTQKVYNNGAAADFIERKLERGIVSFPLDELAQETGLSTVAARNQLLRLRHRVVRVSPRQPYFLIVQPQHRAYGAPPPVWWLDAYFKWLGKPYYLALLSAAAVYGSSHQAVQETQVITDSSLRMIVIGRIRIRFFMKSGITRSLTQQLPRAYAPLTISTPETTAYDLIRYADRIGGIERAKEVIGPMKDQMKPGRLQKVVITEPELMPAQLRTLALATCESHKLDEAGCKLQD